MTDSIMGQSAGSGERMTAALALKCALCQGVIRCVKWDTLNWQYAYFIRLFDVRLDN